MLALDGRRARRRGGRRLSRRITADTALRLARYFRTTERFWLNLQSRYDLEIERDRLGEQLAASRPLTRT
ncbi:MAG: helix-turn-helix transcriptional regulator [Thermocrispum sp.]